MEEATTRQRWLLALGLTLALVPSRLVDLSPGLPRAQELTATPAEETDPARLALAAPDLLGAALRLEVGPSFEHPPAPPEPILRAPVAAPWRAAPKLAAHTVAEPPGWWLGALSLASAAGASRGTRRFPRWHRRH